MQIWAEPEKSALPICNYSQILYQFFNVYTKLETVSPVFLTLLLLTRVSVLRHNAQFSHKPEPNHGWW